jgi:lipopolysaccharide biosynthesis protein
LLLEYFLPPFWKSYDYQEAAIAFIRSWRNNLFLRKPFPGFHPGIYQELHGVSSDSKNPLADFLEKNKPQGPWLCEMMTHVLEIDCRNDKLPKIAVHVHVYFLELFSDIFDRLCELKLPLDLFISVPSSMVRDSIQKMTKDYIIGGVDIRIVPNRGRDIGPLLTEFNVDILNKYDIVGHFHTKKSCDINDLALGDFWYTFLLENLLGGKHPMATLIISKMCLDENIGLVYADDPNVVGWTKNFTITLELARQFDIHIPPGKYFNFPVGSMFWARTNAIRQILGKGFGWTDYPEEPIPYDGTMLHAIERLWPFIVKNNGYCELLTYVDGVTR